MNRREALKQSALLMGYSLSGIVFAGSLEGCQVDTGEDWQPDFFSDTESDFISEFAEHILPRTDTVGGQKMFLFTVLWIKPFTKFIPKRGSQHLKKTLMV